jgi:hypothetical protein
MSFGSGAHAWHMFVVACPSIGLQICPNKVGQRLRVLVHKVGEPLPWGKPTDAARKACAANTGLSKDHEAVRPEAMAPDAPESDATSIAEHDLSSIVA